MSSYNGKLIRLSKENYKKLTKLKLERGYSSYDRILTKLISEATKKQKPKKKLKRKRINLFDSRDFGL